jgi:hypothetical protein
MEIRKHVWKLVRKGGSEERGVKGLWWFKEKAWLAARPPSTGLLALRARVLRLTCAHLAGPGAPPSLTFTFGLLETPNIHSADAGDGGAKVSEWAPSAAAANCSSVELALHGQATEKPCQFLKTPPPPPSAFDPFLPSPIQPFGSSFFTLRSVALDVARDLRSFFWKSQIYRTTVPLPVTR